VPVLPIRAPEDFDVVVVTIFSRSVSSFLSTYLSGQVPTPLPFLVTLDEYVFYSAESLGMRNF